MGKCGIVIVHALMLVLLKRGDVVLDYCVCMSMLFLYHVTLMCIYAWLLRKVTCVCVVIN